MVGMATRANNNHIQAISSRDSPIDALTLGSQTPARDFTVQNSPTTVEDVLIAQVPANDILGTKSFVDVSNLEAKVEAT